MRRNGAALEQAQQALAEVNSQIEALVARRREALLHGSDAAVARVDTELEAAQRLQRTRSDRVALLVEQAEAEAAERRAREHAAHILRVERKLEQRDAAAAELASCIAAADAALCKLVSTNRIIQAGWPFGHGHLGAVMLDDGSTVLAVANEIYRVGGRAPVTGGVDLHQVPTYPGARCADLNFIMMPERSARPLVERFAEATAAAKVIMRTGRNDPRPTNGHAAPAPTTSIEPPPAMQVEQAEDVTSCIPPAQANGNSPPAERTEAQRQLSSLLVEQARLADLEQTAEVEAAYAEIGRQIAEATR
jgi:hypothetical protein